MHDMPFHWTGRGHFDATRGLGLYSPLRRYFYCTAFGLGRALHHMQQLNAAESGGAQTLVDRDSRGIELRIGRLQRQKVRVSRKRILESAVKVRGLEDTWPG